MQCALQTMELFPRNHSRAGSSYQTCETVTAPCRLSCSSREPFLRQTSERLSINFQIVWRQQRNEEMRKRHAASKTFDCCKPFRYNRNIPQIRVMNQPELSAVILSLNDEQILPLLRERLENLQHRPVMWELLFVGDGSTDGSAKFIEPWVLTRSLCETDRASTELSRCEGPIRGDGTSVPAKPFPNSRPAHAAPVMEWMVYLHNLARRAQLCEASPD